MERPKTFAVLCENKTSYQIALTGGTFKTPLYGAVCALVRCDRLDPQDNARGLRLADMLVDFLNGLPEEDRDGLLAPSMQPKRG